MNGMFFGEVSEKFNLLTNSEGSEKVQSRRWKKYMYLYYTYSGMKGEKPWTKKGI